jgi:hypothetical protein
MLPESCLCTPGVARLDKDKHRGLNLVSAMPEKARGLGQGSGVWHVAPILLFFGSLVLAVGLPKGS